MRNGKSATASDVFVGRNAELEILHGLVDEANRGRGAVVLVGGEPGIGKTRLAEEIANYTEKPGMRVLWGSCWPAEEAPAFWPWIHVLRARQTR